MSVINNVMSGYHTRVPYSFAAAVLGGKKIWDHEKKIKDEMMELLSFVGLADFAEMNASELSGGQRRLLVLARAIAGRPKLLMLDEPAAGLSPHNIDNLMKIIMQLKDKFGLTLIIIEHILKVVMDTCDTVTVFDHGQKIAEGAPAKVKDDNAVIEAYLGKKMNDEEMRKALAV
jgi:branched-chain amino acid transport system ATP-binding protein